MVLATFVLCAAAPAHAAEKILKQTMSSSGVSRTYYLYVPESAAGKPAPLLVLLHGSGRDGRILVEHWRSLAEKEGIVLAGPDATVRNGWSMNDDGPLFLRHLVEAIQSSHAIDRRRVYVFGHSAGAVHGLAMAILESEYFAAIAVHAGVVSPPFVPFIGRAPRKIPVAIWVGSNDAFFPLTAVRASRDALNQHGFDAVLTEINGHTHDYYRRSSEINRAAWAFLSARTLDKDPQYQDYVIAR
jgi:poly(3-hydroxybutyrate) depolymerase